MNLDDLKLQPVWKLLTDQEKVFVETYVVSGGDVEKATRKAFNTKEGASTRVYGRKVLGRPTVVAAINLAEDEGEPSEDEFLAHLWHVIRSSKSDAAKVSAMNLYAQLKNWIKRRGAVGDGNEVNDLLSKLEE